jgi:hypothetical protein
MKGKALFDESKDNKNILEEKVQRSFETVNTICDE